MIRFFQRDEIGPGTAACTRILFALFALASILGEPIALKEFFGPRGIIGAEDILSYLPLQGSLLSFINLEFLSILRILAIAGLLACLVGWHSKIGLAISLAYHLCMARILVDAQDPIPTLLCSFHFYLLFLPIDIKLSLNSWLERAKGVVQKSEYSSLAVVCMQFHLSIIYATSVITKLTSFAWLDGTGLAALLRHNVTLGTVKLSVPMLIVVSNLVWILHALATYLLWHRRYRIQFVAILALFHVLSATMTHNHLLNIFLAFANLIFIRKELEELFQRSFESILRYPPFELGRFRYIRRHTQRRFSNP